MKIIKPIYRVDDNVTYNTLKECGFKRVNSGEVIYRFSVYKYMNRKPLIFCEFLFDEEEKQIHIIAKDLNGNIQNYNKEEYGKSDVITEVNKKINNELNALRRKGIIE